MNRIHNFSAGPAILPTEVLEATSKAVVEYQNFGMSVMEMSHRSKPIVAIFDEASSNLLKIMNLSSDNYSVLFLQGGASTQFAMVALNFLSNNADYINTGSWADKAIKEAKMVGNVNVAGSSKESNFNFIPKELKLSDDADYLHFTSNNTIFGTRFDNLPETKSPLICDMSSDFLSRELDYSKFDLIYAGAQKNVGPAGATLVVVKKSFLEEKGKSGLMTMMSYKTHHDKDSMFNTPPVLPVFIMNETFKWILNTGLKNIEETNIRKANKIYNLIDSSNGFYVGSVTDPIDRSLMNVTFNLKNEELNAKFIKEATANNLDGLKGHRSVGGIRASIYNACPETSVDALVSFMTKFMKENN
ncbi:3-phosphoserine/phosphohydroxythreonine transaminase [Candidatus Kapabacteria bacterium]|nr:3-phosphoserine/phosphohydroxythreonine transaminase [Candidatus Kapabacteria bacterium]